MKYKIFMAFAVMALAGCSNSESPAANDGKPAAAEPVATPAAAAASSISDSSVYDLLPDKTIKLSFPFTLRSDKTVVAANGKSRRGVSLAYSDIPAEQLWASISASFADASYTSGALKTDSLGKGSLRFSKEGTQALAVSVAPDANKAGAGVIWIGWDVPSAPSATK